MAKKLPAKTKKPSGKERARGARSGAPAPSRPKVAAAEKYQQSGAPWWKAYLPPS
jgi:hypothetical protein